MTQIKFYLSFLLLFVSIASSYAQIKDVQINEDCSLKMLVEDVDEAFSKYTLQWSQDGKTFQTMDQVDEDILYEGSSYTFSAHSTAVHNYYRLKMMDEIGGFQFSNVFYLRNDCGIDGYMEIYPNPVIANKNLYINFFTDRLAIQIVLYDADGEEIKIMNVETPEEWNAVSMDLSALNAGAYFLEVGDIGLSKITIKEETLAAGSSRK